jgi:hypothetical protein
VALIAGGWLESNDFQTVASFYRQTGHRMVQVGREAFKKVRRGKHHTWPTRFQTLAASTVYDVSNSQKASCAALVFFYPGIQINSEEETKAYHHHRNGGKCIDQTPASDAFQKISNLPSLSLHT